MLLVVPLVILSAIAVGAFLFWSPAHAATIAGFQGRYAIPLLPALMLAFSPPATRVPAREVRMTLAACALLIATGRLAYTVRRGVLLYG